MSIEPDSTVSGIPAPLAPVTLSISGLGYGPGQYLIQATDGNFYGTTNTGGAMSPLWEGTGALSPQGTVFRMTPTGVKTTLHSFGPMNMEPTKPEGGVIQGSDGAFYGLTFYSKAFTNGQGTVFRLVVN